MRRKTIKINNILLSYLEAGDNLKPSILILHGWGLEANHFSDVINSLGNSYHVIAPDLAGFGQSALPKKPFYLDDYIDIVARLIKSLEVKPLVILGHSFGGRIAIKAIAEKKLSSQKLILTGAAGISDAKYGAGISFLNTVGAKAKSIPLIGLFFIWLARKRSSVDYKNLGGTMKETFKNIISENLEEYLSAITQPALLLWGSEDSEVPVEDAIKMNGLIEHSTLKVIDGAQHNAWLDQNKLFLEEVNSFLELNE